MGQLSLMMGTRGWVMSPMFGSRCLMKMVSLSKSKTICGAITDVSTGARESWFRLPQSKKK